MSVVEKQEVQDLLDAMRRPTGAAARMQAFRHLVARLNYTSQNQPVAWKAPAGATDVLADGLRVLGVAGADDAHQIIYGRFAGDSLSRMNERRIVTSLQKNHPYALYVFSTEDQDRWHFLNVKSHRKAANDDDAATAAGPIRQLFRRITISPEDRLRTATERIERLDLETINGDIDQLSPLAIQQRHDEAFDVEAVTEQFFRTYREVFERVEAGIKGITGDRKRLFTQRLFNRLMFIAFIQKKGWLKFPAMEDNDYLDALWRSHKAKTAADGNFYNDRLRWLFFRGLNTPNEVDIVGINKTRSTGRETLTQKLIGDVPYLNGGLFEMDEEDKDTSISIPDKAMTPSCTSCSTASISRSPRARRWMSRWPSIPRCSAGCSRSW